MKWLRSILRDYIIAVVTSHLITGGHCTLCGKWVDNCIVPAYWRFTVCEDCINGKSDWQKGIEEWEEPK